MAILHNRHRQSPLSVAAITFLLLASGSVLGSNPSFKFSVGGRKLRDEMMEQVVYSWRRLGGPGSSPPTCRSKCGRCAPCTPVHISIQPGLSVPLEYYPEAWRCKCKNKNLHGLEKNTKCNFSESKCSEPVLFSELLKFHSLSFVP